MPKMTAANRALMAHQRIDAVLADTRERVFLPLRRQLGPSNDHVLKLGRILAKVDQLLPEFDQWSQEEATRAEAEAAERHEAQQIEYAARRKERNKRAWSDRNKARNQAKPR